MNSKTVESIYDNLRSVEPMTYEMIFSHNLPIPDAQNYAVVKSLALNPNWIWFVEEDIVIPEEGLKTMLMELGRAKKKNRVISAKYNVKRALPTYQTSPSGRLLFSGLGCLLIHSSVFEKLSWPYFEIKNEYSSSGDELYVVGAQDQSSCYGKQDIDFFFKLQQSGIEALLSSVKCQHHKLKKMGDVDTNSGCHQFEVL